MDISKPKENGYCNKCTSSCNGFCIHMDRYCSVILTCSGYYNKETKVDRSGDWRLMFK